MIVTVSSLTLTSCLTCTLIGCEDQVSIVGSSSSPLQSGRYQAIVFADGEELEHEVDFMAAPGRGVLSEGCATTFCFTLHVNEDGVSVSVISQPRGQEFEDVRVEFMYEDAPIGETVISPVYETQYPNGRQCGAVCRSASTSFDLD